MNKKARLIETLYTIDLSAAHRDFCLAHIKELRTWMKTNDLLDDSNAERQGELEEFYERFCMEAGYVEEEYEITLVFRTNAIDTFNELLEEQLEGIIGDETELLSSESKLISEALSTPTKTVYKGTISNFLAYENTYEMASGDLIITSEEFRIKRS